MIQSGKSSKMIADRLEISKHTIDRHRQNIIAKLPRNNTTDAGPKAKRVGLIDCHGCCLHAVAWYHVKMRRNHNLQQKINQIWKRKIQF